MIARSFCCVLWCFAIYTWPSVSIADNRNLGEPHNQVNMVMSELYSLIFEGHELHASLTTCGTEQPARHMSRAMVLPTNPYISTDGEFVEAVAGSTSMGRRRTRDGFRSALYACYGNKKGIVLLRGLEAESAIDADWRETALRKIWDHNVKVNRAMVHRKGLLLVVVWHEGLSLEHWNAVNRNVTARLSSRDRL